MRFNRLLANHVEQLVPPGRRISTFVAHVLARRSVLLQAFAFLHAAAFTRVVAGVVSVRYPNEEGRLSIYFGFCNWTLPVILATVLIALAKKEADASG